MFYALKNVGPSGVVVGKLDLILDEDGEVSRGVEQSPVVSKWLLVNFNGAPRNNLADSNIKALSRVDAVTQRVRGSRGAGVVARRIALGAGDGGVLRAFALRLVRSDDDVGGDEEGVVLGRGHHVVRDVPDAAVERLPLPRDADELVVGEVGEHHACGNGDMSLSII